MTAKAEIINKIIVTVGNKIITQYDIESFNPKKIKEIYTIKDEDVRKKTLDIYFTDVKKILVNQAVLEIAAAKDGVQVSEDEADDALQKVLDNNKISSAQLEVLLIKENMTLPKYKLSIKEDIFQSRLRSRVITPKIVITLEDINHKVDELSDKMSLSDQLELRMIVLDEKTKIKEVNKYLEKYSFTDTAIKFSVDSTAKQAGYLGWIKLNKMSKELYEVAKDKSFGETFSYVDNEGKKMIFHIDGTKSKYDIDLELKGKIITELQKEKFDSVFKEWLKKHRELIYIDYVE